LAKLGMAALTYLNDRCDKLKLAIFAKNLKLNGMRILTNWLMATAAVLIVAYLLPGVSVSGFLAAFVTAVVIGFINTFLRPVLVFLTLPLTIFSFGLFLLVINAGLIMLAGALIPGFTVTSFGWALLFSLLLSIVNSFLKRRTESPRAIGRDDVIIQKGE